MTRYVAAALFTVSSCIGMAAVVPEARDGGLLAAWLLTVACALSWIAAMSLLVSAILRAQRPSHDPVAQPDRATAS